MIGACVLPGVEEHKEHTSARQTDREVYVPTTFWQCAQNQAVRPPIVADFNSRPQRGHRPPLPRCGSSQDLGIRFASALASIAFFKMSHAARKSFATVFSLRAETCVAG